MLRLSRAELNSDWRTSPKGDIVKAPVHDALVPWHCPLVTKCFGQSLVVWRHHTHCVRGGMLLWVPHCLYIINSGITLCASLCASFYFLIFMFNVSTPDKFSPLKCLLVTRLSVLWRFMSAFWPYGSCIFGKRYSFTIEGGALELNRWTLYGLLSCIAAKLFAWNVCCLNCVTSLVVLNSLLISFASPLKK